MNFVSFISEIKSLEAPWTVASFARHTKLVGYLFAKDKLSDRSLQASETPKAKKTPSGTRAKGAGNEICGTWTQIFFCFWDTSNDKTTKTKKIPFYQQVTKALSSRFEMQGRRSQRMLQL